jgi:hypothetical protein
MLNWSEKGALVAPFLIAGGGIDNLQSEGDIVPLTRHCPGRGIASGSQGEIAHVR